MTIITQCSFGQTSDKYIDLADLKTFSKEWIKLTLDKNEKVIFNPCDANNRTIDIVSKDSCYTILEGRGQGASYYEIKSAKWTSDTTLTITAFDTSSKKLETIKIDFTNSTKSTAIWTFSYDNFETKNEFVNSDNKTKYLLVKEPCD